MQHRDLYPHEILQDVIEKSYAKSEGRLKTLAILSFLGGGYVSFGYMAYLKVVSGIPPEWSGLATLLGAAVFPICLICILIGGGELATGNMMMALGRLTRRVSFMSGFQKVQLPQKLSPLPKPKCKWILAEPFFPPSPVTGWSVWAFGSISARNKPPVVSLLCGSR